VLGVTGLPRDPGLLYLLTEQKELVRGSLLRRNGSFGGRSKITQTPTSDFV
jgi:hypothetical protein